jgi:predicted ester cyclase
MKSLSHPELLKSILLPWRKAMGDFDELSVKQALERAFNEAVIVRMCHPFGAISSPNQLYDIVYKPLFHAMPDLERRDLILLAGTTPEGQDWIGCMGNYMGTFVAPFLDIPPTGHLTHMRYHEFFKIEDARVVEMHVIWDLPELMMQANAWPMAPQLGAFLCTPGPISGDGLTASGDGRASLEHIKDMETAMCRYPENPDPSIMQLEKFWHPRFNWYGPAGIGTGRGISGFRHWHQIPFLRGMPDRKVDPAGDRDAAEEMYDLWAHYIAEGPYVCETGWPNMRMKLTHDGWMGIAPAGKEITLRSLDFWLLDGGKIRENWVQIDVLYTYVQLGVDVFARLREFNKARNTGPLNLPIGEPT